jgi:hypothetical protein
MFDVITRVKNIKHIRIKHVFRYKHLLRDIEKNIFVKYEVSQGQRNRKNNSCA